MKAATTAAVLCVVYSVVGAVFTFYFSIFALFDLRLLFAAVCAVAIVFGGVWSATKPERGRKVALAGIIGLLPLCFLFTVDLVPEHNRLNSPINFAILGGYVALLSFALFYPRPYRFSWLAFATLIVAAILTYTLTYQGRLARGEYDRPSLECFRWDPNPTDDLIVSNRFGAQTNQELVDLLRNAGIRGTVERGGSGDAASGRNRLIVLSQAPPPMETKLFFPKQGSLVYAFDGARWRKFPPDAPTFPVYASFRPDRANTMICGTRPDGGNTCFACFNWERQMQRSP